LKTPNRRKWLTRTCGQSSCRELTSTQFAMCSRVNLRRSYCK
jgi:hypothetical protein